MRKSLYLAVAAVATGLLAGCGGGGGGGSTPTGNQASRVVVGYVYVENNTGIDAGDDTIVSASSTPPPGYSAPTAGTVTLSVADGEITRAPDSENFNMATGNAIVARVVSRSTGTPQLSFAGTGLQLSSVAKPNIPTTTVGMTGTDNTLLTISYGAPAAPYVPGEAASLEVLARLASRGDDTWESVSEIIDPATVGASYEVVVMAKDANGVVLSGTTQSVDDGGYASIDTDSSETQIDVNGGGTEGDPVTFTFSVAEAPSLALTHDTTYSYGDPSTFVATFSPTGPTALIWEDAAGAVQTINYSVTVTNAFNVPVPGRTVFYTRARSAGGVDTGLTYPGPATGDAWSAASSVTNGSGIATVTFQTPNPAAGNAAFNALNIKGLNFAQARMTSAAGPVIGNAQVTIDRPLGSLTISGATRLDVNTTSRPAPHANSYNVTAAADIDTLGVTPPTSGFSWTVTPTPAGGVDIGDPDDLTVRSVANPAISGASTGPSILIGAGTVAGQFTVQATHGTSNSNTITTEVFGAPAKLVLSPTPTATGYTGAAGFVQTFSATYIDAWGHNVTAEANTLTKQGTTPSIGGANITFPALPSLSYTATASTVNDVAATLTLTGTWTGNGQGTSTGASTFNLTRTVNLDIP